MTAAAKTKPKTEKPMLQYAIVGFTPTCMEAIPLLDDPEWHVAGMNNLHLQGPFAELAPKFSSWFDLHPVAEVRKDTAHAAWLAAGADGVPVYVWEPQTDWPTSVAYPRDEILANFLPYYTNTVSWQIALFLTQIMGHSTDGRAPAGSKIAIYGIDMATGGEYAAQRPSCEFYMGVAAGVGVELVIPERSDLLKSIALYGDPDTGFGAKLAERREVLNNQIGQLQQTVGQATAELHAAQGALAQVDYFAGVWSMPEVKRPQVSQDGLTATT